jgi:hypothetical protein
MGFQIFSLYCEKENNYINLVERLQQQQSIEKQPKTWHFFISSWTVDANVGRGNNKAADWYNYLKNARRLLPCIWIIEFKFSLYWSIEICSPWGTPGTCIPFNPQLSYSWYQPIRDRYFCSPIRRQDKSSNFEWYVATNCGVSLNTVSTRMVTRFLPFLTNRENQIPDDSCDRF